LNDAFAIGSWKGLLDSGRRNDDLVSRGGGSYAFLTWYLKVELLPLTFKEYIAGNEDSMINKKERRKSCQMVKRGEMTRKKWSCKTPLFRLPLVSSKST
jgi:hypothetical protein